MSGSRELLSPAVFMKLEPATTSSGIPPEVFRVKTKAAIRINPLVAISTMIIALVVALSATIGTAEDTSNAAAGGPSRMSMLTAATYPGSFVATGNMTVSRAFHSATLLDNGMVLIAGGNSGSGSRASAELYDPASGSFTPTGSMNRVRERHTATLLNDGRVLITGGDINNGPALASAELYDPRSGTFTLTVGTMNVARTGHTATLLNNGQVLIAGGSGAPGRAELYDPATETFTPTARMVRPRVGHAATLLDDGRVLITGGGLGETVSVAVAELFDPASLSFQHSSSRMHRARTLHSATKLADGRVLVAGGQLNNLFPAAPVDLYNPATGLFVLGPGMVNPRFGHTAVILANGDVLFTGGEGAVPSNSDICPTCPTLFVRASAEVYSVAGGVFELTARMGVGREGQTATLLPDGEVLIAGGQNGDPLHGPHNVLKSAELFEP